MPETTIKHVQDNQINADKILNILIPFMPSLAKHAHRKKKLYSPKENLWHILSIL